VLEKLPFRTRVSDTELGNRDRDFLTLTHCLREAVLREVEELRGLCNGRLRLDNESLFGP
jgi:hypothetical protein